MSHQSRFRQMIFARCCQEPGHVALPESSDPRVIQATEELLASGAAQSVTLLTAPETLKAAGQKLGIDLFRWGQRLRLLNPNDQELQNATARHMMARAEARGKSLPEDQVQGWARSPLDQAAYLLGSKQVDGVVAGCVETTAAVIRAALRGVGMAPGVRTISGSFVMVREEADSDRVYLYGDCGVVIDPDPDQLADIASATVQTFRAVQTDRSPVLAFLSFSTKGSAQHPMADKVVRALDIFRQRHPEIEADGELQFDAAFDATIGSRKAPGSLVPGRANCFIFPNLDAGNIAYKITQRLAGFDAYGPLLQGTAQPYMDLSRGAAPGDISMSACIAMLRARSLSSWNGSTF